MYTRNSLNVIKLGRKLDACYALLSFHSVLPLSRRQLYPRNETTSFRSHDQFLRRILGTPPTVVEWITERGPTATLDPALHVRTIKERTRGQWEEGEGEKQCKRTGKETRSGVMGEGILLGQRVAFDWPICGGEISPRRWNALFLVRVVLRGWPGDFSTRTTEERGRGKWTTPSDSCFSLMEI